MNVSGQILAHSLKMKLALLAAFLPGPRIRYLPFNLSFRAIICNSDDYEKILHPSEGPCVLRLKSKSQKVIGIH